AGSPDGRLLPAVSSDGAIILWDTATGKAAHRLQGAGGWLAFTPDGKSLAFNRGGKLCLLDLASQKVGKVLGSAARHGAFAADGKTVTLVQEDGVSIRRLDLATGKPLVEWRFRPEPPKCPAAPRPRPELRVLFIPKPDPFSV